MNLSKIFPNNKVSVPLSFVMNGSFSPQTSTVSLQCYFSSVGSCMSSYDDLSRLANDAYLIANRNLDDFGLQIEKVVEVSLSANQKKSEMRKLKWRIEGDQDSRTVLRGGPLRENDPNIEVAPMEIRTFLISFVKGLCD